MAKTILVLIALTAVAAAQSARISRIGETVLHGRRAVTLENDRTLVSTLRGGGFIGEVRFKSSDPKKNLNVMSEDPIPDGEDDMLKVSAGWCANALVRGRVCRSSSVSAFRRTP